MNFSAIAGEVERHISGIYQHDLHPEMVYHNLEHTRQVLDAARKLCDHYQLDAHDRFVVETAVWFHDIGQVGGLCPDHEARGAAQAEVFLAERGVDPADIDAVKGCIMATDMPQSPKNLLEQIIADSDLFHLSSEEFKWRNKLVRQELEHFRQQKFTNGEWRNENIKLLESHQYHTDYARMLLTPGMQANLERLKKKEAKVEARMEGKVEAAKEKPKEKDKKAKAEDNTPTRGIETMFRISLGTHNDLSAMADSKANIMISVNSIIITVVLSVLLRKLEEYPNLILPTIILLTVNVTTIVFAILAVRPKIISGVFTEEDIKAKRANLLFFGNFHKMPVKTFEWGMREMMKDKDYLYGSLIIDLYYLGVVLGRKFNMLRVAYNVFMYGLILSVLSFGAAVYLNR